MEKAKVNEFGTMTIEQASLLPLDGKKNDKGEFTSLSLKRGLVIDDGKCYVERRVFKNADMPTVVVYDLELPLDMDDAVKLFGEQTCLDYIWGQARVDTDASKAGKGGGIKDPEKAANKFLASLPADLDPKKAKAIREALKLAGFGK